ncbi:MAG: hypothetical protein Q8Q60_04125 [Candidatus Chromulinivorax sp.]|nr:hypothetical protein [Candidatus Chromulinivorax sp.]
MLYNRLKLMNGCIVLLALLISVHAPASYKSGVRAHSLSLSPIKEEPEEESYDWEIVAVLDNCEDSHELVDIERTRAKSLDCSTSFFKNASVADDELDGTQDRNKFHHVVKTHYDEVLAQLQTREWALTLQKIHEE